MVRFIGESETQSQSAASRSDRKGGLGGSRSAASGVGRPTGGTGGLSACDDAAAPAVGSRLHFERLRISTACLTNFVAKMAPFWMIQHHYLLSRVQL
jgi:hypothetical protein